MCLPDLESEDLSNRIAVLELESEALSNGIADPLHTSIQMVNLYIDILKFEN